MLKKEDIKLLLTGNNDTQKWDSLAYISALRPVISIKKYFKGFSIDRSKWKEDEWNEEDALNFTV